MLLPILLIRKLNLREVENVSYVGHTDSKWQGWDSNPILLSNKLLSNT